MRMIVLTFLLTGLAAALPSKVPSDANHLLEATARKYQQIGSYQGSATAERPLDEDLTLRIPLVFAYASAKMTPRNLPLPMLSQAILEEAPQVFDRGGKLVKTDAPMRGPGSNFSFDQIAWRVLRAKITGKEVLHSHLCVIADVQYEGTRRNPNGEPVRYWIDPTTDTIWKMQFSVLDDKLPAGDLARWTIVWDMWTEDQPPPAWELEVSKSMSGVERPALIGHQAPEVKGRYLDGKPFELSALKGDVVVLDFWATWCGPCAEEMASLEQLKRLLPGNQVAIVSVTEDSPTKTRRWMAERRRILPVANVPRNTAFLSYGIDELPQLVIIDRKGIVVRHWAGMRSQGDLRQEIEKLLAP